MNNLVEVKDNKILATEKASKKIEEYLERKLELEIFEKELKEEILELMDKNNIHESFDLGGIKVTYVKESNSRKIDSKKLKEEQPDLYLKYSKESHTNAYLKLGLS